jgi:hypothetical protein
MKRPTATAQLTSCANCRWSAPYEHNPPDMTILCRCAITGVAKLLKEIKMCTNFESKTN